MKNLQFFTNSELRHLLVCNSNNFSSKQQFYELKKRLLEEHAEKDGIDLQTINRYCYSCVKGVYTHDHSGDQETCYKCCGTGIYSTKHWLLQRYRINDILFHVPIRTITEKEQIEDSAWFALGAIKNFIEGAIIQTKTKGNPYYSYMMLLYSFDRSLFYKEVNSLGQRLRTRAKHKFKNVVRKAKDIIVGLAQYFGIIEKEEQDLLPF